MVRPWAVLAVLCVSLLLVSLDNTVLNVALPTLVRDLHATESELQWIVDAYSLVFAGLLLVAGSLGDRFGRRGVFLVGLLLFGSGSALSAFSGTPSHLIAARVVMGVGSAAIMPSTLSILTNVFVDDDRRARAIAIWSGTTGLGIAVGPIVGGWLLAHYWWGSVFLINVPIAAAGIAATAILVPTSRDPAARPLDPLGAVGSLAGLGLLLWGVIDAPQRTWTAPAVLTALTGGAAVLALFAVHEARARAPMLRLRLFASRRFSSAMASMLLVIFALMGSLFVLTQYLQFSLGYSAFQTGLRVGPIAAVLLVVAPSSALLVRRVGTKAVVFAGMSAIVAGLVLLSRTTTAGGYLDALPALLLVGTGTGLAFAPSTESVMGAVPRNEAGVGAATNSTSLQVGGALGVAVMGSVLGTRYEGRLRPLLAGHAMPPAIHHAVLGSLGGALQVAAQLPASLGDALAGAARSAFVSGLGLAMLVGAGAVAAGAAVVLALLPSRATPPPEGDAAPLGAREDRPPRPTSSSSDGGGEGGGGGGGGP